MTAQMQPYRPSNGSEGESFMAVWCAKCERDRAHREDRDAPGCPIIVDTMAFAVDDPKYPPEWQISADHGRPICTAFTSDPEAPEPLDPSAVVRPLL